MEKYVTTGDYVPNEGYTPDQTMGTMTEQAGYVSLGNQIKEMLAAGERLDDWRRQQYPPGSQDEVWPVYRDKLDALEAIKRARAEIDKIQEQDNKILAEAREAERLAAIKDAEDLANFRKREAEKPPQGEPPKS